MANYQKRINLLIQVPINKQKLLKALKKQFSDFLSQETDENFVFANMTPGIINDALNKLKSKNSSGPDKISTKYSYIRNIHILVVSNISSIHILAVSIYQKYLHIISIHILEVSTYYQYPYIKSIHLLSVSIYWQYPYVKSIHML